MEEKKRTKAEYRSSLRSKRLIREALVTMMRQKPFEKITITDIVKTADINRGTFYVAYSSDTKIINNKFVESDFANSGVYYDTDTTKNLVFEGNRLVKSPEEQ